MSPTEALAAAAGALAGAGTVDLAASLTGKGWPPVLARAVGALARLGERIGAPSPAGDLAARLDAAGRPLRLSVAEAAALKAGAALVALGAGAPLAAALPGRLPILFALALPPAGYLAPDLVLARRARARARAMELELPDLLDLLRVAIEAGLPPGRALAEVARRHRGLLAGEWRAAAARIELGVPRATALEAMVRRCPLPAIAALAAALERAERHGAPLADTLLAHAREARAERGRRIREHAARAAPKIQLVVALLLVPSVLLLVAAALVAALTG